MIMAKVRGLGRTHTHEREFVRTNGRLCVNRATGVMIGCDDDESRVLGAYGRDVLNDNG